jgi:hypothetical protein
MAIVRTFASAATRGSRCRNEYVEPFAPCMHTRASTFSFAPAAAAEEAGGRLSL